jgi:hypothetical protein
MRRAPSGRRLRTWLRSAALVPALAACALLGPDRARDAAGMERTYAERSAVFAADAAGWSAAPPCGALVGRVRHFHSLRPVPRATVGVRVGDSTIVATAGVDGAFVAAVPDSMQPMRVAVTLRGSATLAFGSGSVLDPSRSHYVTFFVGEEGEMMRLMSHLPCRTES